MVGPCLRDDNELFVARCFPPITVKRDWFLNGPKNAERTILTYGQM